MNGERQTFEIKWHVSGNDGNRWREHIFSFRLSITFVNQFAGNKFAFNLFLNCVVNCAQLFLFLCVVCFFLPTDYLFIVRFWGLEDWLQDVTEKIAHSTTFSLRTLFLNSSLVSVSLFPWKNEKWDKVKIPVVGCVVSPFKLSFQDGSQPPSWKFKF